MIPAAQKRQILFEFNNTKKTIRKDKNYCQLFQEQVSGSPDKIAAVFNDQSITYDELNREAGCIGVILARAGVRVNRFVALYLNRSIAMLAAIIGVFKAGGAYVPIDVDYPAARIAYLFADSEADVVITDKNNLEGLQQPEDISSWEGRPVICLDHGNPLANVETGDSLKNNRETTGPDDLVYMMYTSGTTGKPKGAMIHQLGMLNHMFALIDYLSLGPGDIIAQDASASFDISRWQFLAAPMFGGCTFIIDNDILVNPLKLLKILQQGKITILEAVPSLASAILNAGENEKDKELKSLRWMMLTGESIGVQLVRDWCHQYPGVKTLNAYGPTEASDDVTFHLIDEPPGENQFTVPIGKPLQNLHIYIMDQDLRLCPIGVEGEICVAGLGVGKGYWKDPLKTANSFVPNPLLDEIRDPDYAILYRTGDIGYYREDGTCECLGRIDHQVKIRGLRIETGEIESYLIRHKDIKEAVVVLSNEDQGEKYLKACIVSSKRLIESDIRKYLSIELPHYMIPAWFVQLEKLPLTPNGKVDRKLLQTLEVPRESHEKISRDEVEKKLADIWAEVLGIEAGTIGPDANFFQLGGDSILCLQMVLKAKQAGIAVTSAQVFSQPVIEELVGAIKDQQPGESNSSLTPVPLLQMEEKEREQLIADNPGTRDIYPLTPIQKQMFSYNILAGGSSETILHLSWVMTGHLDIAAFEKAWQTVTQRHCILRTAFKRRRFNEPLQLVYAAVTIPFQQLDCTGMTEAEQDQALADYLGSDKEKRFKMSQAPLMRLCLVILNHHSYRFICSYSSLLLDNWSSITIVKEVFHYYDACTGKKPVNREKPRPLKDYVQWLLGREQTGAKESWRNELQGFDSPVEPGIQRFSRENINKNFTPTQLAIRLLPRETRRLTTWAREHQLTLGTILQGAWIITLSYLSGEEDVLSAVLSYGRSDDFPGIDSMVGLFINTIPVRVKVPARQDLITWLKEFQDQQVRLRQFDYVTIDYISRWSGVPLEKIQKAIYERTFVLAKSPGQEFFTGLTRNNPIKISQFDDSLILNVPFRVYAELSEHTIIRLQYDASCFPAGAIRQVAGCLEKLLKNIIENPGVLVGDLQRSMRS
jgi:amino acid adenylation domain-containing protein